MKKKMAKTLAVLMCMMTAVAFMPTFAFAAEAEETAEPVAGQQVEPAEPVTDAEVNDVAAEEQGEPEAVEQEESASAIYVKVTISNKGTLVLKNKTVEVTDINNNGQYDIDDTLYCAHNQNYPGGAAEGYNSYTGEYGLSLGKLWGDGSGNFGYYVNNNSAWSLADTVSDGNNVYAFVYKDQVHWSDSFVFFDETEKTIECENLNLEMKRNLWGTISPYANAKVGYYSGNTFKELGTTDAEGKVSVSIPQTGTFLVSAKAAGEDILVPPVCIVTVQHNHMTHTKVAAGLLKNGYEYDNCTCGATKLNYKSYTGWSTNYVKSFKVSKGKKCFTAKWKKQSKKNRKKFSGYQLRYSKYSNMAGAAYLNVSKSSKSKKVKKLAKKTKYYVQVRSYTDSKGVRYYAGWSGVKSVKTK